jgi:cell division protein ZipA
MPSLIQVSVIAGPGRYFRGEELKQALLDADLLHGDMGIFHRYDVTFKKPQFSVASLVEPGTFPIDQMESFNCPGIALFFQVARVTDPLAVFDDLINTSRELAAQLHGIQWDESRQPLTASKISRLRHLLGRANID